jgi:transposase
VWPRAEAALFSVSETQFEWLLTGVEWQRLSARVEDIGRVL